MTTLEFLDMEDIAVETDSGDYEGQTAGYVPGRVYEPHLYPATAYDHGHDHYVSTD